MNAISDAIAKFGFVRLVILSTLLLSVAGLLFYLVDRVSKPDMGLLYADLDLSDSGRIVSKLDSLGIPSDVKGGGTQIYVPVDEVGRMRMVLAEDGLPNGGSIGYEIFDRSETLGTSSFVQDINRVRALEGELSRTIRTISKVSAARVHLVLPRRELFNREAQEARASIVLKLGIAGKLPNAQVTAIQHLVAAAVSGLKTKNISVIDDRGNLLARGDHEGGETAPPTDLDEARFDYERKLASSLEALIGRIVGPDKVRAEITAEMDFDRITENSEKFDPEGQVIRSIQTVEEGNTSSESESSKAAGVKANIPGAAPGGTEGSKSSSNRNEETTNYEISKTLRTHLHESGGVKKLSVALLVDNGRTVKDGKETVIPRTPEELKNIEKLVKSAIGFDQKRGDVVEVVNMPFAPLEIPEGTSDTGMVMGLERHQLARLGEVIITGLFGLLILLLVVKPLLNRVIEHSVPASVAGTAGGGSVQSSSAITGGSPESSSLPPRTPQTQEPGKLMGSSESMGSGTGGPPMAIANNAMGGALGIEGTSALKSIGQVIESHPEESMNVVRSWINEGEKV